MGRDLNVTRDISYASCVQSGMAQTVVRALENGLGRRGLIRRARGYQAELGKGRDVWQVMVERFGLSLELTAGTLADIPRDGPVIVVSNHPFGILDGLILGHILSRVRSDFRILAHDVFLQAKELDHVILPVSFSAGKDAAVRNIMTRKQALAVLAQGGAIGVFPGGTVSTSARPFGAVADPVWRIFTAKMIATSGATVVPIFFHGANSRWFQLASHLHFTLRMGLLIHEFRARVDRPVRVAIGAPFGPDALAPFSRNPKAMMDFLRTQTYALSRTDAGATLGFEFDERYRAQHGRWRF